MKKDNEIAAAIYLTGSIFTFIGIYYLFSTNSSAFSGFLYVFPILLLVLGIYSNRK